MSCGSFRTTTADASDAREGSLTPNGATDEQHPGRKYPFPGPAPGWPLADAHRRLAGVVTEADIRLADGRTLHAYDTGADGIATSPDAPGSAGAVFWLHGSPNIGSPPPPPFPGAHTARPR